MRLPSPIMVLAAATSLALVLPYTVHAASVVDKGEAPAGCSLIASSVWKCDSQPGEDTYYRINQDGKLVKLFIVNGKVAVLPAEHVTVHTALVPPAGRMPGIATTVYRDSAAVEIDALRDSQQQLHWVVQPMFKCAGSDCSGDHILLTIE